ncbi:MAG: LuxR C-terminal-related transcriptional regulator [Burkholderiales bacterium]
MFDLQAFLQAESRRSLGEAIRQTFGSSLGARSFLLVGGAPARSGRISPIVVAADFPQSVMAQLHANPLCENIPLMNEWLQHERPICQQLDKMRARALSPAVNQMRRQGCHSLAGHGCFDLRGSSAIFLLLVDLPDSQMSNAAPLLQLALPLIQASLGTMRYRSRMKYYEEKSALSAREAEVLKYARHGMTNKEISSTMGLSFSTIKNHMAKIARKLGVKNRAASVAAASSNNLLASNFGESTIAPR